MSQKHAVIIGGGLGGLASALRLSARGWAVTVCEQGTSVGGKMNRWSQDGYTFDTGPSLITMPDIFNELFKTAGSRLSDHLDLVPMHPLADYIYPDGTRFTYSTELPQWLDTIRSFEPEDVVGFYKFLDLGSRIYELSNATFFRQPLFEPPDRGMLGALRRFPIRNTWGNYHKAICDHFKSPYLRQLYGRYPTYVGSSPYESPATLAVIPYIEYAFGGWYVKGGLYGIIEALVSLAEQAGITIHHQARVQRINHDRGQIRGIQLEDGTNIESDIVVMNGDVSCTSELLGEDPGSSMKPSDRSMSGFVMLLGIRRTLPQFKHHTIYFSEDYKQEFSQLFDERRFPDDPTVYVNMPSRSDRSVVPDGGETLFIMANTPANVEPWDEAQTRVAQEAVFKRLKASGFPDIEDDVVVSDTWTPGRIANRYSMPGGAIYGTHSHGWRRAFLRPPNKDRRYRGLYYVGGSTHPGGGTPTVILSSKITCDLIKRYEMA